MPRLPRNKILVGIYLPKDLVKELREHVKRKYDGMYGLSLEVEQAIRYWLSTHKMHKKFALNPTPKVYILKEKIKEYLKEKRGYTYFIDVYAPHLYEAIKFLRGHDKRTIKKWIDELERFKCIKWIDHNRVEIL